MTSQVHHHSLIRQSSDQDSGYGDQPVMYATILTVAQDTVVSLEEMQLQLSPLDAGQSLYFVFYREQDPQAEFRFPVILYDDPNLTQEILPETESSDSADVVTHGILGRDLLTLDFGGINLKLNSGDSLYLVGSLTRDRIEHPVELLGHCDYTIL